MVNTKNDLSGRRFGRLVVIQQAEDYISKDGNHRAKWTCKCDCGKIIDVLQCNLIKGNSESCGCTRSISQIKHGGRYTRLYRIWTNMKSRCYNAQSRMYQRYGLRGVQMCDEWRDSFEAFRDWSIANGYKQDLTIDRVDNNGDYCPENCRWVDAKVQANNRRSSKYITVDGVTRSLAEWADDMGYSRSIFHARAKLYHTSIEEQVVELVRNYYRNVV